MTAIHVLLLVALLETAINRIAVPMLRPVGEPPTWHVVLDYVGLFSYYFTGVLAVFVIGARVASVWQHRRARNRRDLIGHAALAVAAAVAALPLLVPAPEGTGFVLEIVFAAAVIALVASVFSARRDLGIQIGLPIMALPLVFHTLTVTFGTLVWPEEAFDAPVGPGTFLVKIGVLILALAALATPYCFGPRPFARAVTRPIPIIVAMSVAALGAVSARLWYPTLVKATKLGVGIDLNPMAPDPRLALHLLALATLAWTLAACLTATSESRRTIGAGLAFILLGGYAFEWPHEYLLPLVGFALIVEASHRVRDEELEAMPIVVGAPPITDATWSTFVGTVAQCLRRTLGEVHSLTMRGEHDLQSSVIVGEVEELTVRTRIERLEGSVIALDIVVGREIEETRDATFTLWALPPKGTGSNPPGPPASPSFKTGDDAFDTRFKVRGDGAAFARVFDEDTRGRALATLDGWLAYWDKEGLRYRVYPNRGAPLDHPLPLSDLAQNRIPPNAAERLAAVVELLAEVGTRVLEPPAPAPEPTELDS